MSNHKSHLVSFSLLLFIQELVAKMKAAHIPLDKMQWYVDLRKYGSVPHAGMCSSSLDLLPFYAFSPELFLCAFFSMDMWECSYLFPLHALVYF